MCAAVEIGLDLELACNSAYHLQLQTVDSCHACIEADSILWYTNLCELSHIPDIESVLVSTDHTNQLEIVT